MTNSQWVTYHLCQPIFFIWHTDCEQEYIYFSLDNVTSYILSHADQQEVCDMLLSDHITSHYMRTGSEWNCTSCPKQSIKSYLMANRGSVMLVAHYFIIFHASSNVWQDVSVTAFLSARHPYLILQQIGSEWGCTFAVQTLSHIRARGWVLLLCWRCSSQPHPMTNS